MFFPECTHLAWISENEGFRYILALTKQDYSGKINDHINTPSRDKMAGMILKHDYEFITRLNVHVLRRVEFEQCQ